MIKGIGLGLGLGLKRNPINQIKIHQKLRKKGKEKKRKKEGNIGKKT
jgi:hypothetical protein